MCGNRKLSQPLYVLDLAWSIRGDLAWLSLPAGRVQYDARELEMNRQHLSFTGVDLARSSLGVPG